MAGHRSRRGPTRLPFARAPQRPGRLTVPVAALVMALPVHAANWEVEPGLRLAQTWTDNVTLAADDTEHEWITEVTPRLRLRGEGRRAQLDLRYRMQNLAHWRDSDRDRTTHLVAGDGELELLRRRLFLEGDVSRVRTSDLISPTGPLGDDTRRNVTTYGAGPRLQYEFGRAAGLLARHRRERVDFGTDDRTTDTDLSTARLASGPVFTTWGWALNYSRLQERRDLPQAADDEFEEDVILERGSAELSLRVTPSTQLFGVSGYEDNQFRTEVEGERIDGSFWEAGARWSPSRTVFMEAAVGERFFGETGRFLLRVQGAHLTLNLSYNEDLITTSRIQAERTEALVRDQDGNLILDPDGEPLTAVISVPTIADDVILQRRAQGRLGWERGYSELRLTLIGTEREFQFDGRREETRQADLGWTWTRLRRTTVNSGIGVGRQEFVLTDRVDDFYSFRLGATRDLGDNLDLSLDYRHFDRDSNVDGQEFTSNRITLALEATF